MRKKIEIKVYLPYTMVGELERLRKSGKRSEYIEKAVRARLDDEDSFNAGDLTTRRILSLALGRYPNDEVLRTILLKRMEELE